MGRFLFAIMVLCFATTAQGSLVGRTYTEVIKGTDFDPARKAPRVLRQTFIDTLNGPQTPGVMVRLGVREFLVYEACTAHLCAYNRSVTVIDRETGALYAAVYGDTKTVVVANPEIERLIGHACDGNRCNFQDITQTGAEIAPEPLIPDDLKGFPGGANCRAFDQAGRVVLYTDGRAVIRFRGSRRLLSEDGIGGYRFYSVDHEPPMVVMLDPREGRSVVDHETSIRPRTLTILFDNRTVAYPVTLKCES